MSQRGDAVTQPAAGSEVRTFVLADVRGYTRFTLQHGDAAAARLAAQFAGLTREVAAAHGGEVIELRGDEALAVFRSARSALRAAVDLQERCAGTPIAGTTLSLLVGIGVDAGEAIPLEGGYRGAALNLAARLCSLAGPGEVLASEGVVHLARKLEGLAYVGRGAVQLKGFSEPVRVVQVVTETAGDSVAPLPSSRERPLPIGGFLGALPAGPLVARASELGQVLAAADLVEGGSGRLVFLVGEPGIGKTRLAQEVTLVLRNRGVLVASGRCYAPQETVPFYPFLEALGTLYSAAPSSIREAVPQRWPYLGRLLPAEQLPLPPAPGESPDAQERLFWSVTGLVQAIADERPVALLLDDLHWADSTSLALLQHLARHTRAYRVFLLGTYRDVEVGRQHPLERALRDLHREQLAERVVVRRLGQEETAALIATTFGEETISAEFSALVYRHTEGNPFFTQEVLSALVGRGDVYQTESGWDRRSVEEIEVPESVRSAIGERLSRLSAEVQGILHEASVLGQTVGFEQLQALGEYEEQVLDSALGEATTAGLLRVVGNDTYAFSHALTQQALYAELSPRRKRKLHLAAGKALERLPQALREERAAELAWHFLQADEVEQALTYSLLAGEQAGAVYAHPEAERHYNTVVQLAREVGNASVEAQALEKLGVILSIVGKLDQALDLLERAIRLHRTTGNVDAEARALAQIGRVHSWRGTPREGIARLTPVLEQDGSLPPQIRAAALVALARLFFGSGKYEEQLRAAEKASQIASELGNNHLLAEAELRRGAALGLLGRPIDGQRVLEHAAALLESVGNLVDLAVTLVSLAAGHRYAGEFDVSRRYLERAVELTRQTGDRAEMAFAISSLGTCMFYQGEWSQARVTMTEALTVIRSTSTLSTTAFWKAAYPPLALGELSLAEGKWKEASTYLDECIAVAERSRDLQALRQAHRHLAERELMAGHPEAAIIRLKPLSTGEGRDIIPILLTLATAHLEEGDVKLADQIANEAVTTARAQDLRPTLADSLRTKALIFVRQNQWHAAREMLEEGLSMARAMRYPYAEARLLYEYGMMYAEKGEPDNECQRLEEALAIFSRLGAGAYGERAQLKLAQLR